jgi:hypothetical protein
MKKMNKIIYFIDKNKFDICFRIGTYYFQIIIYNKNKNYEGALTLDKNDIIMSPALKFNNSIVAIVEKYI